MIFCETCKNLLSTITTDNKLTFLCKTCLKEFKSEPKDTLMLSIDLKESDSYYKDESYINLSVYDNLSILVKKDCENPNCDETIIKMITIEKDLSNIYICPTCSYKFT